MPLPDDYAPARDVLAGRVVLVTGAGDGIGRTAAITFARHGATVLLLGRTQAKLEAVYDDIVAAGGAEPGIAVMDLKSPDRDRLLELAGTIDTQYGRLDGLLHNAAMLGDRVPVEYYDVATWRRVMQVNVGAVFELTQRLLPLLRASPDASIVMTTSSVGAKPRAYWGAYAVSKYAMEGLALLLADELENTSSVRVNLVNPGATRTRMRAEAYPGEDPAELKTADALMPLYLYLVGPDSKGEQGRTFNAPRSPA